jgi:aspartate aminotransferase
MLNEENKKLGQVRSVIRELFEYGKKRKAEIGADKVFDFSLGNPSVPAPPIVKTELINILNEYDPVLLHGYTSAPGDINVRKTLANYTNQRFGTTLTFENFYMTCGAAASLCISLNALLNKGEEVITFAPYFPEYRVFTAHAGGTLVPVNSNPQTFMMDFDALEKAINVKTRAVIINSPNNPSGVVYSEEDIKKLSAILLKYSQKFGNPIYLISDEPYRELVFDKEIVVPYIMNYYANSLVCYSYSKSLSLPGERIGYIAVNNHADQWQDVYAAVCGAGRALGFVCAPNLFQQLVGRVYNQTSDISVYKSNRDLLSNALTKIGYTVIRPDGAFYLFVKSLEPSAAAFAERAKQFELLIVPGEDFGTNGYVRIAYCVSADMIKRSLPAFQLLYNTYQK